MEKDLDEREQDIVRKDIMNWKQESPEKISDDEWEQFRTELENMSPGDLVQMWETNVGEWILSRQDVHSAYDTEDGNEIVKNEFRLLLDPNSQTNYGYL